MRVIDDFNREEGAGNWPSHEAEDDDHQFAISADTGQSEEWAGAKCPGPFLV
jgi:hypothetical protein